MIWTLFLSLASLFMTSTAQFVFQQNQTDKNSLIIFHTTLQLCIQVNYVSLYFCLGNHLFACTNGEFIFIF